jgi:hypothetical protein
MAVIDTASLKIDLLDTLHYKNQVLQLTEVDSNAFLKLKPTSERDSSLTKYSDSANVWAHDSTIVLQLETEDSIKLISKPNDPTDGIVKRFFVRFIPALNSYLIMNTYYENGDFSLINRLTGKETLIYGEPVISPDGHLVICYNADVMTSESANGFQILSVNKDWLHILWTKDIQHWGPEECRWQDNSTIYIRAVYMGQREKYLKLALPDFSK